MRVIQNGMKRLQMDKL